MAPLMCDYFNYLKTSRSNVIDFYLCDLELRWPYRPNKASIYVAKSVQTYSLKKHLYLTSFFLKKVCKY